jgi:Family of unknown function (DUF6058)
MVGGVEYTTDDLEYIRSNYLTLEQLCSGRSEAPREVRALIGEGRLPKPSYVLDDGTEMFPADYFRVVDEAGGPEPLRERFSERLAAAGAGAKLGSHWQAYLDGIYGVCLVDVTPETIARKAALVSSLSELLMLARPGEGDWRRQLREEVEELDALERPFSPDYDRNVERFGRLPTRDLLIRAARVSYPEVFAAELTAR